MIAAASNTSRARLLRHILVLLASTAFLSWVTAKPLTDPATGVSFPGKLRNGLEVMGVGVRKKGPLKIYSVALYGTSALREGLASRSRSTQKTQALETLRDNTGAASFRLQMTFKVGSEKMAAAIADAVAPRHSGPAKEVDQLKALILKGVNKQGGEATKGTTFQFDCSPNHGVSVAVNDQPQGGVASGSLAKAFQAIYLDDHCVCPSLRESCVDHCCAP
jgi:ribosomal protein L14